MSYYIPSFSAVSVCVCVCHIFYYYYVFCSPFLYYFPLIIPRDNLTAAGAAVGRETSGFWLGVRLATRPALLATRPVADGHVTIRVARARGWGERINVRNSSNSRVDRRINLRLLLLLSPAAAFIRRHGPHRLLPCFSFDFLSIRLTP